MDGIFRSGGPLVRRFGFVVAMNASSLATTYSFGSFRFDPARSTLYHGDAVVPLPERLGQILALLIRGNGMVIDKDTIASSIWPGSSVSDVNLWQYMYMLRQLLQERAGDRNLVATVRGRGYRFVAPVRPEPPVRCEPVDMESAGADRFLQSAPELLHHYWRGSYLLEKRTAGALAAAAEQFEAALRIDAENVPGLIGLARTHALIAENSYAPGRYAFRKAKAAIARAVEIDPASPEARATLGNILLFCDWNWIEAEREIECAIALKPTSSCVYASAASFYMYKGDSEEPLRRMQRALLTEPSSPWLQVFLARTFLYGGDYRRAIHALSNLIESGSDFAIARRHRAQALILNGQPEEALVDLLLLPQDRAEDIAVRLPLLARAHADCGDAERAQGIYRSLLEMTQTEYVAAFNLATVAVALGRLDEALDHLQLAMKRHEPALLTLRSLPWFEPIAYHPRFKELLRAIWPAIRS